MNSPYSPPGRFRPLYVFISPPSGKAEHRARNNDPASVHFLKPTNTEAATDCQSTMFSACTTVEKGTKNVKSSLREKQPTIVVSRARRAPGSTKTADRCVSSKLQVATVSDCRHTPTPSPESHVNAPSPPTPAPPGGKPGETYGQMLLDRVVAGVSGSEKPLMFTAQLPARVAEFTEWPEWVHPPSVVRALAEHSVRSPPWIHQSEAADLAYAGKHVVVATGTASGKSLAYQLPVLTAMATDPLATALYLSPTKALGSDQLRAVLSLTDFDVELRSTNASAYDGDTSQELRTWARENSRWLFTNPDMIHISLLRTHQRWAHFFRNLKYVIIDECHSYRGVFGSNVALVIRRLRRIAARYAPNPPSSWRVRPQQIPAQRHRG